MLQLSPRSLFTVLCLGVALVAACGKKDSEKIDTTPAAFRVTNVELGRGIGGDKHVLEKTSNFRPTDVIYASVLTTGASSRASLKARWSYEDGQLVDETEQVIAPTGDAATEFHISKPDGWPTGKYKLEVLLNGSSVHTHEFKVE